MQSYWTCLQAMCDTNRIKQSEYMMECLSFYPALLHIMVFLSAPSEGGVCDKGGVKWGVVCQWEQLLGSGDCRTVYDPLSAHPRVLYGELS